MTHIVTRLSANDLTENRLDPYFYRPEFVRLEVDTRKHLPEFYEISAEYNVLDGTHNSVETRDIAEDDFSVPFLRAQDIGGGYLLRCDGAYLRIGDHIGKCKRSAIRHGDVLLNIMASTGQACVYSDENPASANANRAVGILRYKTDSKSLSSRYLLATFLSSGRGGMFLARTLKGSIQKRVNLEDIRECRIPKFSEQVERYIGDKVRQAERLRERGRELERFARISYRSALDRFGYCEVQRRKSYRTKLHERLDPAYYDPVFTSVLDADWLIKNSSPLKAFIADGSYGPESVFMARAGR